MKALLSVVVLVVLALAVVAEWGAPRLVADRVEQRVNSNLGGAAAIEADAGSFPFVPRLLADNRVRRVTMSLEEIAGEEVPFGSVAVELRGIVLDRQQLFSGDVEVTAIESGTATLTLRSGALDRLRELLPGGTDPSELAEGQRVPVPLPSQLVPCTPRVQSSEDATRLSCEFQQVPSALLQAAQ